MRGVMNTFFALRRSAGLLARVLATALPVLATACGPPGPNMDEGAIAKLPRATYEVAGQGYTVSYLHAGDAAGHRVLFVHGTPGSAGAWADYLANVPSGFEYVAVDRPGFGESGPDGAVTSLENQARALDPLIKPGTVLVGHSLGGPIIAKAAALFPDKVAGLIIVAGSLDPGLEEINWLQYVGDAGVVSWMLPRAIRNANSELMPLEGELEILSSQLERIRAPVIIIHGTQDDLVPFANVAFMKAKLTNAKLMDTVVLDGLNHFLPWNSKPVIDKAILKMEAGRGS